MVVASTLVVGISASFHLRQNIPVQTVGRSMYACAPLMTSKVWQPGPYQGSRREGGMRP